MKEPTKLQAKILKHFAKKKALAEKHGLRCALEDVSESMGIKYSTFYGHMKALAKKGYVTEDKRELTDKGREYTTK